MDREKVVKGLEYHLKELSVGKTCFECNYCGDNPCEIHLITDALALLKEHEPVEPRYEDYFGNRIARCGKCNGYIVRYKYCPGCGHEVRWRK